MQCLYYWIVTEDMGNSECGLVFLFTPLYAYDSIFYIDCISLLEVERFMRNTPSCQVSVRLRDDKYFILELLTTESSE